MTTRSTRTSFCTAIRSGSPTSSSISSRQSAAGSRTATPRTRLIEAIATVLEREHGFLYVSDDRLSAAVNVSKQEDDNFLAEIDSELDDEDDDEDDTDANGRADADYVTIHADLDFDRGSRRTSAAAPTATIC